MAKILNLGGLASALARMGNAVHGQPTAISNVSPDNWPTAGPPITPVGPPGSQPLAFPFLWNQNFTFTPRFDAVYTASDLQGLSRYPLARICIDNVKDLISKADWSVQLKQQPGETKSDVTARRKKATKEGDENILALTKFLARPNPEYEWDDFIRRVTEDMLVVDAASILTITGYRGRSVKEIRWTPGSIITRYIDDFGRTPQSPDPAYAQLWQGVPRVDLTTDQLIYRPRNIVPRENVISSYLYGLSPVESIAEEIKIGQARLNFVMAYYSKGSLGNVIHVVPRGTNPDKIREAMQVINSEMSGNAAARREWRIIPGFNDADKPDQIIFPKEPALADVFDDLHIRKICFAFGTSAQRLQRQLNRASAQASQEAAMEEGIEPWMVWIKGVMDYLLQVRMGYEDYEFTFDPYSELDYAKKQKADMGDIHEGIQTRNEVRASRGLDPITDNPMADQLTVTTPNGVVELGDLVVSGRPDKGGAAGGSASAKPTSKKPAKKVWRLVERGE